MIATAPARRDRPSLGALVVLALAGCWSQPSTLGLPCAQDSECDAGQRCVDGLCATPGDTATLTEATSSGSTSAGPSTGDTSASDPTTSGSATTTTGATSDGTSSSDPTTSGTETTGAPIECATPDCQPTHVWSIPVGDEAGVTVVDVALDADGNALLTGMFRGQLTLGGKFELAPDFDRIYLAKFAPDGALEFFKAFGDSAGDVVRAMTVDLSGRIYLTGGFFETIDFSGGLEAPIMVVPQQSDIFVAVLSPEGAHAGSIGFEASLNQFGNDIAVNNSGDVLAVAAAYQGSSVFNQAVPGELLANHYNVAVARLDPELKPAWVSAHGSSGTNEQLSDVELGFSQSIVVTGWFDGPGLDLGGGPMINSGIQSGFVARFTGDGALVWNREFSPPGGSLWPLDMETDDAGNIVVTGMFDAPFDAHDGVEVETYGGRDIFALRLDANGTTRWGASYGHESGNDAGVGVAIDRDDDHVLLSSSCTKSVDFGGDVLQVLGTSDICLARLKATDGAHLYSANFGGDNGVDEFENGGPLAARGGALLWSGTFRGMASFGGDVLYAGAIPRGFLAYHAL